MIPPTSECKCRIEAQMLLEANPLDPRTRTSIFCRCRRVHRARLNSPLINPRDAGMPPRAMPRHGVIDRPSALTVVLDWRDPTKCCCREQLWVAARARVSGPCAITGATIEPGNEIFRPRPARPGPRNISAMVLASRRWKRAPHHCHRCSSSVARRVPPKMCAPICRRTRARRHRVKRGRALSKRKGTDATLRIPAALNMRKSCILIMAPSEFCLSPVALFAKLCGPAARR